MDSSNNHSEQPASGRACVSPTEVRDFLQRMKTRSPDEVLGTEANRGLAKALAWSTLLCVLALVVFTAPFARSKPSAAPKPDTKGPIEKDVTAETTEPTKLPSPPPSSPTLAKDKTKPPAGKDFLDKIGATDTKQANPKVNPLEKTADDLFKDIDNKK
jgi:hypothetical protein